jgi:glycosyltransferase involved in cell wall biosynthesis
MILHTQVTLDRSYGGPARTVPALCNSLAEYVDVALLSTITEADTRPLFQSTAYQLFTAKNRSLSRFAGALDQIPDVKMIHDHGIWLPSNIAVYRHARRMALPLVISARGMLKPWALRQKWFKKKIAWYLYQKKALNYASAIHATATSEAEQCRELGFDQPIAVIPNGVEFPESLPAKQENDKKIVLCVSRMHPKKGLADLLSVWAGIRDEGWQLVIAGPDEDGYRTQLENQVVAMNVQSVTFTGNLGDVEKWQAYANADLFVLPTHGENFGVVVAEAMAAGLPVITTVGAPWKLLEDKKCGWWIDIGVGPLQATLRQAMALSDTQRQEMGQRGKEICYERFSWNRIALEMNRVYEYLLLGSEKPDCIF